MHLGAKILLVTLIAVATFFSAHAETPSKRLRLDVFTTEDFPVRGVAELREHHPRVTLHVHRVDRIERLEAELSLNLSNNPDQARRQALERLHNLPKARQREVEQMAKALALAVQLGIERVPAIVIDQERVIYGLTDLAAALAHDEHFIGSEAP